LSNSSNHDISEANHDGNNYIIIAIGYKINTEAIVAREKTLTVMPNFQALGK
jgi:hypothetical protein